MLFQNLENSKKLLRCFFPCKDCDRYWCGVVTVTCCACMHRSDYIARIAVISFVSCAKHWLVCACYNEMRASLNNWCCQRLAWLCFTPPQQPTSRNSVYVRIYIYIYSLFSSSESDMLCSSLWYLLTRLICLQYMYISSSCITVIVTHWLISKSGVLWGGACTHTYTHKKPKVWCPWL